MSQKGKPKTEFQEAMASIGWGRNGRQFKPCKGERKILGGTVPDLDSEISEEDIRMAIELLGPDSLG